jgi:DNA-binding MarR family transcriptional regulator
MDPLRLNGGALIRRTVTDRATAPQNTVALFDFTVSNGNFIKPYRSKSSSMSPQSASPSFTPKQGQYLAFIYAYTRVLGRPPAEADLQRHFGVSPPSVHQMVLTLERAGLIRRQPGVARSIEVLITPELLPVLH